MNGGYYFPQDMQADIPQHTGAGITIGRYMNSILANKQDIRPRAEFSRHLNSPVNLGIYPEQFMYNQRTFFSTIVVKK